MVSAIVPRERTKRANRSLLSHHFNRLALLADIAEFDEIARARQLARGLRRRIHRPSVMV